MPKNLPLYILAVSLFILGSSIGFFAGKTFNPSQMNLLPSSSETPQSSQQNNLFSSQTASLRGEVIKKQGNQLTLKNLNNQNTGTVTASDRLIVTQIGSKTPPASPSADLSKVILNKEALIAAEMINGQFEVLTIQYTTPPPSLPPVKTPNP